MVTVDYGYRGPPVALARDQPVVQPVRHRGLAGAGLLEPPDHAHLRALHAEAVEEAAVDRPSLAYVRLAVEVLGRLNSANYGEIVLLGEVPVRSEERRVGKERRS